MQNLDLFINNLQKDTKTSGCVFLKTKNFTYEKYLGNNINKDSKFIFKCSNALLVKIVLLDIISNDPNLLNESLIKYFPRVTNLNNVTVKDILIGKSSFTNYTYDLYEYNYNEKISADDNFINNQLLSMNSLSEKELIEHISKVKEFDSRVHYNNQTNVELGIYLIEKIKCKKFFDILKDYIKTNAGITIENGSNSDMSFYGGYLRTHRVNLNIPKSNSYNYFTIKICDYITFIKYLVEEIFTCKMWKEYSFVDKNIDNVINKFDDGFYKINMNFISSIENRIYYSIKENVLLITVYNDKGFGKYYNGNYDGMTNHLDRYIKTFYVFPNRPKLVKIHNNQISDLLELGIDENQLNNLSETRNLIIRAIDSNEKIYALVDKKVIIGFACIQISNKNGRNCISSLMIDKRFQGRGYGKILLEKLIDIYQNNGAKEIEIYVRIENKIAYNLYTKLGFKIKERYLQSMLLVKEVINNEE